MSDLMKEFEALRKEGSQKFEALNRKGGAVREFADAKRENSADEYNNERVAKAASETLEASLDQSEEVYKSFAADGNR